MKFKEWLNLRETGTSTSSVSNFSRPMGNVPVTRMYPDLVTFEINKPSRKNSMKKTKQTKK
jgi:hypothetical protein